MAKKLSKKTKRLGLWLPLGSLILALLFVVSLYGAHHQKLLISKLVVLGNKTVSDLDIRQLVSDQLAGKFWHLYPKRNSLLYPREEIVTALARAFPRLATIKLSQPNLQELNISVTERRGDFLWCLPDTAAGLPLATDEVSKNCYFADETGFVFSPAPHFSNPLYFEFLLASSSDPIGHYPLPPEDFRQLVEAKNKLSMILADSLFADQKVWEVFPAESRDWYFRVGRAAARDQWWEIRLNLNQDLTLALGALSSVLADPDFIKDHSQQVDKLEYLDLRFAPKVFYRYNTK